MIRVSNNIIYYQTAFVRLRPPYALPPPDCHDRKIWPALRVIFATIITIIPIVLYSRCTILPVEELTDVPRVYHNEFPRGEGTVFLPPTMNLLP